MKLRWLVLLVALLCVAGAKKPKFTVRFFTETNAADGSAFATEVQLVNPPRKAYMSKIPAISERDVVAVFPFTAPDGSRGCAFKLDEHGRIGLETASLEKRGGVMLAVVNGRQVLSLLIDKRIADGIITIPYGLTETEIAAATKEFPIVGADKKKK